MSRPHTPVKEKITYTFGDDRILAPDLRQLVIDEVKGCVFQGLPEFLDTFFPLDRLANGTHSGKDRLKQFLVGLTTQGLLQTLPTQWAKIPNDGDNELAMLEPLVEVFNAITKMCGSEDHIRWQDVHSVPPRSVRDELLRPDLVARLDSPFNSPVHWHNVLLPFEVKRKGDPRQALPQLITYARVMLKEQWNRQFTFGLICAKKAIQVWLFDRAGAIGSPAINYHDVRISLLALSTSLTQVS